MVLANKERGREARQPKGATMDTMPQEVANLDTIVRDWYFLGRDAGLEHDEALRIVTTFDELPEQVILGALGQIDTWAAIAAAVRAHAPAKTAEQELTANYDAAQDAFRRGDYEAAARLASNCADAFERLGDFDRAGDMNTCYAAANAAAAAIATWNQHI